MNFTFGDFYFETIDDYTCRIGNSSGLKPNAPVVGKLLSGHLKIPHFAIYNNKYYTVTQTSKYCFRECAITSVSIPNSIISIELDTFWGTSISYIYIPVSVKELREFALSTMPKLIKVEFGEGINLTISRCCFYYDFKLNKIVLPINSILSQDSTFEFTNITELYICNLISYPNNNNQFGNSKVFMDF